MKFLAYYLPQFHPTPENDVWWGAGFTEWTNVTKAKPLFPGHRQPKLPADLGFYDLRLPEVMEQQAQLATSHGVDGFVFYHYWFGNGKTMLERPLQQFLNNPKVQCTFCMCWANESWKGTWHGAGNRLLIEQQYGGEEDYRKHFHYLLPFFRDERRLLIDGKVVFQVYMPQSIPDLDVFVRVFREEAEKAGLPGLYLMGVKVPAGWNEKAAGFDGYVLNNLVHINRVQNQQLSSLLFRLLINNPLVRRITGFPKLIHYSSVRRCLEQFPKKGGHWYPLAMPNWDNTPRVKNKGTVYLGESPEAFAQHLMTCVKSVEERDRNQQLVFIKSWNEWAEGNVLEPSLIHSSGYLNSIKSIVKRLTDL